MLLNAPHFAPEYRWNSSSSHSVWELIRKKGCLRLNRKALKIIDHPGFLFCPPGLLIDSEIHRVPFRYQSARPVLDTSEKFIDAVAGAMLLDAAEICERFPGYLIMALVGGKDSMNMLLLPWKNPVLAASAVPNYPLVKDFIQANRLGYDLVQLRDDYRTDLEREILVNCCRMNLEHCRWTGHLEELVSQHQRKVLILKGQWGDNLLTDKWIYNQYPPPDFHLYRRRQQVYHHFRKHIEYTWSQYFNTKNTPRKFFNNLWYEAAHWQGVHMSFLAEMLGIPVLSMYHNRHMMKVIQDTDYLKAVTGDLRARIGEKILGRKVEYPDINPAPPLSVLRKGLSTTAVFLKTVAGHHISLQ